jgi:hypothetical protein
MAVTFTDRARNSDLLKWEVEHRYCRTAGTIQNKSGVTIVKGAMTVGLPVKLVGTQWVTVAAADLANTGGLLLVDDAAAIPEALAADAITAKTYQILTRGPALINKSIIPTTDLAGAAITLATLVTRLATLNIQTMVEPTSAMTSVQEW